MLLTVILIIIRIPLPPHSFVTDYTDSPDCLLLLLSISVFGFSVLHFFYRAMLCIRGTSHGPVSVSVSVSVCHKPEFY